jgi:hypothetical protein
MDSRRWFGLVALLSLTLAACAPGGASSGGSGAARSQTVDGVTFTITVTPDPIQSREPATIHVRLADATGQPIDWGRVVVSLDSRAHAMAPNVAAAEPKGNGAYQATVKPAGMTGAHTLTIDLQWQATSYRATFGGFDVR